MAELTEKQQLEKINQDMEKFRFWFCGNEDAARFALGFFYICHLWDDLVDKDVERTDKDINYAFWCALIDVPRNPFFRDWSHELLPVMATAIMDWHAANDLEASGDEHERTISYTLRVSIVSLLVHIATICGGYEWGKSVAADIRRYSQLETLEEYIEDLNHARSGCWSNGR